MVVKKYPADFGHTTVINNLCIELQKMGYTTGIGAFSFDQPPPKNVHTIHLKKLKSIFYGVNNLGFDLIYLHQSFPNYFLLAKRPTVPVILYYHGASNILQQINFKIMMIMCKNRITQVISVSKAGINQMKKMVGDLSAEVIYNGVNTDFYNPNLPIEFKKGNPQLLFVGGLRPYKKVSTLISYMPELLKKFPNSHLQIVGIGKEMNNVRNLIRKLNLEEKVELTGKINDDELRLRYSSCDIYVSASTFEVCPVPTLEAMSCGKPLVLYDIEPHREIIEISHAGKIFSSVTDFISSIDEIQKNDIEFKNSALSFAKEHDWKKICKKVIDNFEKIKF